MITLEAVNAFTPALEAGAPFSCTAPWLDLCRKVYGYDLRLFRVARDGAPIGGFCCAAVRSALFGNRLTAANPYAINSVLVIEGKVAAAPFRPSSVFPWGSVNWSP